MASFLSTSMVWASSPILRNSLPRTALSEIRFKNGLVRRVMLFPVNCSSRPDGDTLAEEAEAKGSRSTASFSASISTYSWCAALGGLGFIETSYLSYLKLTNSDAFCPIGGASCSDILNSDYAAVFGIPLPLIGVVAYGVVAILGLQLSGKDLPFGLNETNGRTVLQGMTTSMAAASSYFLYILSTKFSGVACSYCLFSAALSLSLFFTTIKDFKLHELQRGVPLQLCIASLVVATLTTSYNISEPVSASLAELELQPFTTEITTESSPLALALASHLHSIGAKMYGAFWCSHCIEQKQMFGREAAKLLDYVECFPNGYRKGIKIEKACADARIEGFPTWVINGQVLSGEQEFSELARASGFNIDDLTQAD